MIKKTPKSKRLVVIADMHCGHKFGLTPPEWWGSEKVTDDRLAKHKKFQRALWRFYSGEIKRLKPIDILVVNGDAIEGKGDKTGGIELITPDRHEQVRMAARAIDEADARSVRACYGTGYHVGKDEDFESLLPKQIKCKDVSVQGHLFLNVNGCTFDIKHKIGKSAIPHGRVTPLIRAAMWNALWAARDRQPRANVIIRSHVHFYEYWENDLWAGVITPALQYNSIFGIRECEGVVNIGFVYFDIAEDGKWEMGHVPADFDAMRVRAESL